MNNKHDLKSLSDDELLRRVSELVAQSRRIEWVLVAHIAEVDARRLYARRASPSMFQYCLDVFHLSEAEAFRRIAAARVSHRYPVVLQMLEDGRLHLTGISVLKKHLTDTNCEEVLARATHKTIEEIKELVAALSPKEDVPPSIRKRPQRKTKPEPTKSSVQLCTNTVEQEALPSNPAPPEKPAKVEPLAPARYKVEFTANEELRDKLKRLEALTPGSDLASIIDAAVTEKLERVEARRYGQTNKPRKDLKDADTSSGGRNISAPVKRAVWERDGSAPSSATRARVAPSATGSSSTTTTPMR